jgi:hypothetical protein
VRHLRDPAADLPKLVLPVARFLVPRDSIRPDLSGVIFTRQSNPTEPFGPRYLDVRAVRSPDDLQQPDVKRALARLILARVLPIWLTYNGRRHKLFPDDELTDAILNPQTTEYRHLLPLAEELRLKWGLDTPAA